MVQPNTDDILRIAEEKQDKVCEVPWHPRLWGCGYKEYWRVSLRLQVPLLIKVLEHYLEFSCVASLSGLYAGECFVWFWPLMKTPISRYLTLVTAHRLDIILTGFRTHRTLDIVSGLQKTGIGIESRVGRERSNNAFSAETGHKFSRSSTRHDLVKPVGGREDERFDLTRISTCFFRSFAWQDWTILVPGVSDCEPGQVRDLVITKLVTRSRSQSILSPADHHTLKQKLCPRPFIIIVCCTSYSFSCVADGIISNWSPGANIIVSCSDN